MPSNINQQLSVLTTTSLRVPKTPQLQAIIKSNSRKTNCRANSKRIHAVPRHTSAWLQSLNDYSPFRTFGTPQPGPVPKGTGLTHIAARDLGKRNALNYNAPVLEVRFK